MQRLREFILETINLRFANINHFVNSSTVLGYLHENEAKLKLYEGVCVSEIQTAGEFVDSNLKNLAWVEGDNNPPDRTPKPRSAKD